MEKVDELYAELKAAGIRTVVDDSDNSPGYKFNEWELRGVPVRIEVGPRDIENNQVVLKARDADEKQFVSLADTPLVDTVQAELTAMQTRLFNSAVDMNASHIYTNINTLDELSAHIEAQREAGEVPGWVLAGWDGTEESEAKIKEATGFTTRNIPFAGQYEEKTTCIVTGAPAKHTVWLARAY